MSPLIPDECLTFYSSTINAGKTPAWDLETMISMEINETAAYNPLPDDLPGGSRVDILAAGQTVYGDYTDPRPITAEAIAGIESGELKLFVIQEIRYRDISGEPQVARFFSMYNPATGLFYWRKVISEQQQPNRNTTE